MNDWIRGRLLTLLRVPPKPEPPAGAVSSLRIFRAGRRFYWLRLVRWVGAQVGAAAGIAISIVFLHTIEASVRGEHPKLVRQVLHEKPTPGETTAKPVAKGHDWETLAGEVVFGLLRVVEGGAVLLFLAQLPVTLFAVRLEYEMHWYMVTDRSLRIRRGVWRLQEQTMSFANVQHVTVSQGPLQRLLGLADLEVRSAGGGDGGQKPGQKHEEPLHVAVFRGIEDAEGVRDLVLARLRAFRASGLGDPEENDDAETGVAGVGGDALAAARALLDEARALRRELSV